MKKTETETLLVKNNSFKSVVIGKQEWMLENLNVSTFRNGNPITEIHKLSEFRNHSTGNPAFTVTSCLPEDNVFDPKVFAEGGLTGHPPLSFYTKNYNIDYGKLYNWAAVNDPRGLAPEGWHIPTDDEWMVLMKFLGKKDAAMKMKSISGWRDNGNGTNDSGFTALAGGRAASGNIMEIGTTGNWWTATEIDEWAAQTRRLHNFSNLGLIREKRGNPKGDFLSVRCIKD